MKKLLLGLLALLFSVALAAQPPTTTAQQDSTLKVTPATQQAAAPKPKKQNEEMVLICLGKSSVAYHRHVCGGGLSNCKSGTAKVTVSEAKNRGYRACKKCY